MLQTDTINRQMKPMSSSEKGSLLSVTINCWLLSVYKYYEWFLQTAKKNLSTLVLTLSSLDYLQGHCIPGTAAIACSSVFLMFSRFFAFSSTAPISD